MVARHTMSIRGFRTDNDEGSHRWWTRATQRAPWQTDAARITCAEWAG